MAKPHRIRAKKAGLPPGTLIHTGPVHADKVRIRLIDYNEQELEEKEVASLEECFPYMQRDSVTWINIDGLHQVEVIEAVGKQLDLHPLVLEDIVNTQQRPKMEDYEGYLFLVAKMLFHGAEENGLEVEQLSLVLGPKFVISFQERIGDVFDPVRERIRGAKGRIRRMKADYLCYALLDIVVDNYFRVLEQIGDRIEELEDELISDPTREHAADIHRLKRELLKLRRSLWPLREVVNALDRTESPLIRKPTRTFLRDVYDHTIHVLDTVETFRDMSSGLLDLYLSSVSNRMNEVMKVLTIIATIFIPLTFIAGVYGMNFEFMPELAWRSAYFIVLGIMLVAAVVMVALFRKRGWL